MLHQDTINDTTYAEDLQAALDGLVPEDVLADVRFRQAGVWFALLIGFRSPDVEWVWQRHPHQTLCRKREKCWPFIRRQLTWPGLSLRAQKMLQEIKKHRTPPGCPQSAGL